MICFTPAAKTQAATPPFLADSDLQAPGASQ